MCGISGVMSLDGQTVPALSERLQHMNDLQAHRGPDGEGRWTHPFGMVGLGHRRLSVIDVAMGAQPMRDAASGCVISYNGEVYNYKELRAELGAANFRTNSDTEVVLQAWLRWGPACVERLRGMFAFAIWDSQKDLLFCARDRFGVKPFYYTEADGVFHFASEVKALLPFLSSVETDVNGLRDYLAFQLCLAGKTMFNGVHELPPGHSITVQNGKVTVARYWEVFFDLDFSHKACWFEERTRELLEESVALHLRSDVPVGAYISGGIDSGIIATLASQQQSGIAGFTGTFDMGPEFDETAYARDIAQQTDIPLYSRTINVDDFVRDIGKVMYHLDYPVAGPGSFSQFEVSALASKHRKVVLGGQGGDEVFGGYTRYLIAYFEQCIKAAIDGTSQNGNFVVNYESIIPNLSALRNYKPMLQEFWRDGLFSPMNERYFRLINRAPQLGDTVRWNEIGTYSPFETFLAIFDGGNLKKDSYFDRMTHFDFKTLLPALLHVEDRVSMAHGLEARVPMLDHPLVEFAATIPADVKFTNGELKRSLMQVARGILPQSVTDRKDKMGFPTPFAEWARGGARDYVFDVLSTKSALSRQYVDNKRVLELVEKEPRYGRNLWAVFSLELWQQSFHDVVTPFSAAEVNSDGAAPLLWHVAA
ncbi:MAG: asparagine synthase (glutamine-hydrolyzing) [Gemmatimonadaceae bacterium]